MIEISGTRPFWSTSSRAAVASVAFLTVIPVGRRIALSAADVTRAAALFGVTGAAVGALSGLIAWLVGLVAPPLLAGVLAVTASAVVTGCLHLDGLADTADGFGGRTAVDRLRIMRDHTIGAYGATALVLVLLAKTVAYATLAGTPHVVAVAAAAGAVSRLCGPLLTAVAVPISDGSAHTSVFHGRRSARRAIAPVLLSVCITIACLETAAWMPLASAVVVVALVARSATNRLGGVTGDTMGAASELIELTTLMVFAATVG